MNKVLIAAALLAASALPAVPAAAATMAMSTPAPTAERCMLMPLTPGCMAVLKAAHDSMMTPAAPAPKMAMAMPKMTMPAMMMPMWWTCVKAPAGSGHLLDCTMPKMAK